MIKLIVQNNSLGEIVRIGLYENDSSYFVINDCGQLTKYHKSYFRELNKGE